MAETRPPIVSVIIPTYNRAHCLRAAIDSALAQTLTEVEVVVVDDASQDQTQDLLASITDSRLVSLRHDVNKGAAAARNTGMRAARGRYFAFLDSDDSWRPEKAFVQSVMLNADASLDAVTCGYRVNLLDHGESRDVVPATVKDWRVHLAVGCDFMPGSTLVVRREVFERIGGLDENLPRFEDWDWVLRLALAGGTFAVAQHYLAVVNNRRGRLGDALALSTCRFLQKHAPTYAALPARIRRRAHADAWLQVVATYAFEGKMGKVFAPYVRAFAHDPFYTIGRGVRGAFLVARGKRRAASARA